MRKKLRLAGHPLHPALSDLPVGLLTLSVPWQVLAVVTAGPSWWEVAFWTLAAGLALAVPTALTGFWDYAAIPADRPAKRTARWHLAAMVTALSAFAGSFIAAGRSPSTSAEEYTAMALSISGLAVLVAGAWLGGHLVFRHGEGVREDESRKSEVGSRK